MRHLKYYSVVLLIFNFGNVRATEGLPCGINQSTNITGAFIHSNGSAIFQSQVYPEGSYGQFHNSLFEEVSEINKNATHLRGCFCHLRGKPCLPFCCPPGFVKRSGGETCYDYTHEPYVKTSSRVDRKVIKARDKFRLVHGVPCCSNATLSNDVDWELFDNGSLYLRKEHEHFGSEMFCFDPLLLDNAKIDYRISICFQSIERHEHVEKTVFYEILGMIFSIIFLTITLVIYSYVPKLRILRGKLLMCYMGSVIAYYTFMSINIAEDKEDYAFMCSTVVFLCYVSVFLALFFLNAISIDYFMTFYSKDFRLSVRTYLFRWYVLYCVGGTICLMLFIILFDADEISPSKSSLGGIDDSCFFQSNRLAKHMLLLIVEAAIILVNIILLLATLCKMRNIKTSRSMTKEDRIEYNYHLERESCCHLTLMFLAMDFSWLIELTWFIFVIEKTEEPGVYEVFDFFTHSQGIWIFIFCIFNGLVNS